jgi:hypothetical protein
MPPAGYPAFLQYLQSGRVSEIERGRAQVSSQASQTPPVEGTSGADYRLLADGFIAATAPRMRRTAVLTVRPSRKAAPALSRIPGLLT